MTPFIAVDWGTTNRRAWLVEDGRATDCLRDARGVTAMQAGAFPAAMADIRARLGDHPALIAGMAGSDRGWRVVPYVPCPAGPGDLARAIGWIEPGRTGIVPGLCCPGPRWDVMRGEEVQILGAVAAGLIAPDATVCQPGTHAKWADVADGRIARFTSAMTGELFALLRDHSLLSGQIAGSAQDGEAFRQGLAEAARRDLAASLFAIRARGLLDPAGPPDPASYASGLLIGSDVQARDLGRPVDIIADDALGPLYQAAVEACGGRARCIDSGHAFVAGMTAIRSLT